MATTLTLGDLRQRVRERADMEGSQFVTDAELTGYINQSAYELYDLLVQKYGDDYFVSLPPPTITTDGTSDTFSLPTDIYKLLGVDLKMDSGPNGWITLQKFTKMERNRNWRPNVSPTLGFTALRYRLAGDKLWLTPRPVAGQTLQLWYVPRWAELSADSDTLDGVSGWTEYVIVDAAIKCLIKEESDPSALMAAKAGLVQRIEAAAANRDVGAPEKVSDVLGADGQFGYSWPYTVGWGN